MRTISEVAKGDAIFADWKKANSTTDISHSALVVNVHGANIYVDQHNNNLENEPVFKSGHARSWAYVEPHVHYWAVHPENF